MRAVCSFFRAGRISVPSAPASYKFLRFSRTGRAFLIFESGNLAALYSISRLPVTRFIWKFSTPFTERRSRDISSAVSGSLKISALSLTRPSKKLVTISNILSFLKQGPHSVYTYGHGGYIVQKCRGRRSQSSGQTGRYKAGVYAYYAFIVKTHFSHQPFA